MRILVRALAAIALLVVVLIGVVLALAPGLRERADGPFPVRSGIVRVRNAFTEVYGLRTGAHVVLFDGGIDVGGGALDVLLGGLHAGRGDVNHVFLTHGHFDHVAHAPLCTAAHIHLGNADLPIVTQTVTAQALVPSLAIKVFPTPPFKPDTPQTGVFTFTLEDGHKLLAFPTPGHTDGSYAYLYEGVLIAGDSIQIDGDHLEFTPAMASVSVAQNQRSIATLGDLLSAYTVDVVCTGHQGCTPEGKGAAMLADLVARAKQAAL